MRSIRPPTGPLPSLRTSLPPAHDPEVSTVRQASRRYPACQHFRDHNAHLTEASVDRPKTATIPVDAPRETVAGEKDAAKWNKLKYQPAAYAALRKVSDETKVKETVACAGGSCELG